MNNMKYVFEFDNPWVFLALIPALFLILFPFFRTPRNKRHRLGRYIALAARILTALLVTTMVSGIHVTEVETVPPDKTVMIVVADHSESTEPLKDEMNAFIAEMIGAAEAKGEEIEMGILTFANGVATQTPVSPNLNSVFGAYKNGEGTVLGDATDIEKALDVANTLFPDERVIKRIVLLSDGRQTIGNAYNAAKRLKNDNVRLDSVSFNVTDSDYAEVALSSVTVTRNITLGETIGIRVRVRSTVETFCRLRVFDGNKLIAERPEALEVGVKTFTFTYTPEEKGIHRLRVSLMEPEAGQDQYLNDSLSENNTLTNWFHVVGKASVLIVDNTGVAHDRLNLAIDETYDVFNITTSQFPTTMEQLLDYDQVVLADLYHEDLPRGADEMLLQYVSKIGRGLLLTGGDQTELVKSYVGTPLEEILPVSMTLDETEYTVGMLVILDISGSMVGEVDRLTPAKEAILKCMEALGEHDLLGIVTFGSTGFRYLEMTPVSNKDYITQQVNAIAIEEGLGGTNYGDGLIRGYHMLNNCDARSKQVFFVSDGEPYGTSPFQTLPEYFKEADMTLSSMYIGPDAGSGDSPAQDILEDMANKGGGNYYALKNSEGIDDLFYTLTDNVKRAMFINEGKIELYDGKTGSSVLDGVNLANVKLEGYLGSTLIASPDNAAAVYADDSRPVFAEKEYGLGNIGLFMSSLTGDWCRSMTLTDDGILFLKNMVRCCMNRTVNSTGLTVTATQEYMGTELMVKPSLNLPNQQLRIDAYRWDTEGNIFIGTIPLSAIGASGYHGAFTTPDPNDLYVLELLLTDEHGAVQDRTTLAYSGGYIKEYDIFSDTGIDLLEGVSERTGGKVMQKARTLFEIKPPELREFEHNLLDEFCLTLALLIFADILARHLIFQKKKKQNTGK